MRSRALSSLLLILLWARTSPAAVEIRNVGVDASLGFEIQGNFVAMRTSEARSGNTDLNGDGDTADFVLQVLDLTTGLVRNSGLEASGGFRMAGPYIAFTVLESRQGSTDLNGDGDATDLVQHVYDASTGTVTNLALAAGSFRIDGDLLTFSVIESAQGNTDLNGDGDAKDGVLHLYDVSNGSLTNVGHDAAGGFVVDGRNVAFGVFENNQGMTDLNGDGDAADTVLHLLDSTSGQVTNLGRATLALQFHMDSGLLAFIVRENLQGNTDLNGDSDVNDNVLHLFDVASGTTSNLSRAVSSFHIQNGLLAFAQIESAQGSSDANADGDSLDEVLHVWEASTGSFDNLGFAVEGFELDSDHLAFAVRESRQGATDLNGDGDSADLVLHLHDLAAGTTVNLGTDATLGFKLEGDMLLAFGAWEQAQGVDLNGDGDTSDYALHVFDIVTGSVINLELDPSGGFQTFQVDGKFLTFGVQELAQGATDLNSDGDSGDVVLHVFDAGAGTTMNLGLDVSAGHQIRDGRVAFAVTEARQGMTDLNGDGDASDVVLHTADLGTVSPRSLIEALIAHVRSLSLHHGTEHHLVRVLEHSLRSFDGGAPCRAARFLEVFERQVRAQKGKKISRSDARELTAEADAIVDALRELDDCRKKPHRLCGAKKASKRRK